MLLLNKGEERMVVRGGGGHKFIKINTCYLCTKNTGNLVVNTGKIEGKTQGI